MARTKVTITYIPSSGEDGILYLGEQHAKRWRLESGMIVLLRFGGAHKSLRLSVEPKSSCFRLHEATAGAWGLTSGTVLCLRYQAAGRILQLGPLLGVLLRRIGTKSEKPFGNVTGFCRELSEAGKKLGVMVYFISAERLAGTGESLSGWSYSAGGWKSGSFPYPDAIYNRINSRVIENSPMVQRFLRSYKAKPGRALFNERYLDKSEVFAALRNEKAAKPYLPESYLYQNPDMMKRMLGRHSVLFLKPILSSLGKGIIRVSKSGAGYVSQTASVNGKVVRARYPNQTALLKQLKTQMTGRRYLLQEGIELIEVEGLSTDFRALVQRDDTGQWEVTSIVARISAKNTFVSNLARGGKLAPMKDAITRSNLAGPHREAAIAGLRKAALDIAQSLEKQIDAHFAELGIDLAVDTRGRVRLLEINSKPSKEDNTPLGADEGSDSTSGEMKVRPSVKRVVQYVRYLGKF
ncbi:YheC/YheD family endospore coat-associated protein [Gorillibacterium timonense]|uniref:YheC/YheD family endospore coat-associated protein n=1 Tax=Gorillibacterium timonense TaxID=1689269 RepID=UPI00071D180A|nr:YheC/YheD family protein [Gorillibacterium timonense]